MYKNIQAQQTFSWSSGQSWFYQGIDLLTIMARTWMLVWGMYSLLGMAVYQLNETVVFILLALVSPAATAGLYNACHIAKKQQNGGPELTLSDYFEPWKTHLNPLLTLGLVLLLMGFLSEVLSQTIFDAMGLVIDENMPPGELMANSLKAQLIATVVSIPLLVVAFFSPQLIFFHRLNLLDALKGSFSGVAAAWKGLLMLSLMVMGVIFVTFFFGVLLSSFLGAVGLVLLMVALLVIFSINICAQFHAFDAIFPIDSTNDENHQDKFHTEI